MASAGDCRQQTLRAVAEEIVALLGDGIVLVAVDGVDGAGKTVFADELARLLQVCHVAVIRASIDGFHNPPSIRYARGRTSPEGFHLDSYDYDAVRRVLLDPLGRHGDRRIVSAIYDVVDEQPVAHAVELAPAGSVLVFDGIFLHRKELQEYWDYSIFLDVDFSVSIPRGALRGRGNPDPNASVNQRYVEGQRRYLQRCRPQSRATRRRRPRPRRGRGPAPWLSTTPRSNRRTSRAATARIET